MPVSQIVQIHVKAGVLHVVLASISAEAVVKTLVEVDALHTVPDVVMLAQDVVVVLAVQVAVEVAVMVAVVVAALVVALQAVLHVVVVPDVPQSVWAVQMYALQRAVRVVLVNVVCSVTTHVVYLVLVFVLFNVLTVVKVCVLMDVK